MPLAVIAVVWVMSTCHYDDAWHAKLHYFFTALQPRAKAHDYMGWPHGRRHAITLKLRVALPLAGGVIYQRFDASIQLILTPCQPLLASR